MFKDNLATTDKLFMEKKTMEKKRRKIIAVGGQPGTGKTTLFWSYMAGKKWIETEPAKLISALYNEERDLYILGKYEQGQTFAGTDRLSMAVQPEVQKWVQSNNCNILFEGDRIFNQSFLEFALTLPDTDVEILYLKAPKDILEQRYKDRGSDQSEKFLRGRETKYANILSNFELMPYMSEFDNTNMNEQAKILEWIEAKISA